MNNLHKLSTLSRRYFLGSLTLALITGRYYDQATDEIAKLILGAIALTGLVGSIQMLRLARKADQIAREQMTDQILRQYDTLPWFSEWNPSIHQVNQTLREIERQERER